MGWGRERVQGNELQLPNLEASWSTAFSNLGKSREKGTGNDTRIRKMESDMIGDKNFCVKIQNYAQGEGGPLQV